MNQTAFNRQNLLKALKGEHEAIAFYEALAALADNSDMRVMIEKIRADEEKHYDGFTRLCRRLFRQEPPVMENAKPYIEDFETGLRTAVHDELEAYELYRDMYLGIADPTIRNFLLEAFTDENEHAAHELLMLTELA